MSRHKFVKTLNLNDELEDYDGVANFEDDEGECVRARDVIASSRLRSPSPKLTQHEDVTGEDKSNFLDLMTPSQGNNVS